MRFRRALDRGNVTEALSSASELEHVGLTEALELCRWFNGGRAEGERGVRARGDLLSRRGLERYFVSDRALA
jgi:hypothetical protein